MWDPTYQAYYYHNATTGETSCDAPFVAAVAERMTARRDVLKEKRNTHCRLSWGCDERTRDACPCEEGDAPAWVRLWDTQSEAHYFFNAQTGATQWCAPEDDETTTAAAALS